MSLRFLYENPLGRCALKLLTARWLSSLCGAFLSSALSKPLIAPFVRNHGIDLSQFEQGYRCFNDFFTRKIKPGLRPFSDDPSALCSPCDGFLSVYPIENGTVMPIKQSAYSVCDLLQNEALAEEFSGGCALVFRLCVENYHRFHFFDSGKCGESVFIPGKLHTVRPIALRNVPVFTENCREYTVLESENFGKAVQVEIGAMLVGRIKNHPGKKRFARGEEKGMFMFGGSTVVLLLKNGAATLDPRFSQAETAVRCGETIGKKR